MLCTTQPPFTVKTAARRLLSMVDHLPVTLSRSVKESPEKLKARGLALLRVELNPEDVVVLDGGHDVRAVRTGGCHIGLVFAHKVITVVEIKGGLGPQPGKDGIGPGPRKRIPSDLRDFQAGNGGQPSDRAPDPTQTF